MTEIQHGHAYDTVLLSCHWQSLTGELLPFFLLPNPFSFIYFPDFHPPITPLLFCLFLIFIPKFFLKVSPLLQF